MDRFSQGVLYSTCWPCQSSTLYLRQFAAFEPAAVQWSACMLGPEGLLKGPEPSNTFAMHICMLHDNNCSVLRCRDCTGTGVLQAETVFRLTYHWASVQETPLAQLLVPPHCCHAPMVTLHVDAASHTIQVLESLLYFCMLS